MAGNEENDDNDNHADHEGDMHGTDEYCDFACLDHLDISLGGRTVSLLSRLSSSRLSTRTFIFSLARYFHSGCQCQM